VIVSKYGTVFAMAIMMLIFGLAVPNGAFLRTTNLLAIVNQSALTAIIASGLTLVLVVGEMDLSIGYGASLAGIIVTGLMLNQGLPMPVAILVTVAMGALIGAVNGTLVTKAGVNAVVATLGVGTVLIGLSYGYTAGSPIISVPKGFTDLTLGRLGGIQNPIWYMPGNPGRVVGRAEPHSAGAAHAGGGCQQERGPTGCIRTDRATIAAFVIGGSCAAITGILLASLLGSGTVSAGDGYLLDSFAAVFLGAATLRDGEFHIVGTLIGVLVVNIGFNGLSLFGTPTFWQFVFKGGILVLAVALSTIARRYSRL
jgi:ribose transport system permease protein